MEGKKKKSPLRYAVMAILAAVLLTAVIYCRPLPAEKLFSGFDFDAVEEISCSGGMSPADNGGRSIRLRPGDEGFDELIALISSRRYSRYFTGLLRPGGTSAAGGPEEENTDWEIRLRGEESYLQLESSGGGLSADSPGFSGRVKPSGGEAFIKNIGKLIEKY